MNTSDFAEYSKVLEDKYNIKTRDLIQEPPNQEAALLLEHSLALRWLTLPIKQEADRFYCAMSNPLDYSIISNLNTATDCFIEPVLAKESDIRYFLDKMYGKRYIQNIASEFLVEENILKNEYQLDTSLREQIQNAPTVKLVDSLIESAVLHRASDIHIEPYEHSLRARFRVDGQLSTHQQMDKPLLPNIISRLKIMGNMNIAEKRKPQDGSFSLTIHDEAVDFRLSTIPSAYGEKAVIRLLYGVKERLDTQSLGYFSEDLTIMRQLFNNPYGIVIITGPTGSGKSTTLTSFISEKNRDNVNITTVEDPVENPIEGVNHIPVDSKSGLDFPNLLRYILRQDPDVIMIGEIRDTASAQIAIEAAITGHLVLSTLHTNDACGVFPRLVDMGVQPYLLAASLNGVIAQRLVRRLCTHCAKQEVISQADAMLLNLPNNSRVYAGIGCNHCNGTGYKGRLAIYEYIIIDDEMRSQMAGEDYRPFAVEKILKTGISTMLDNGVKNILAGNTCVSEVIKAVFRK